MTIGLVWYQEGYETIDVIVSQSLVEMIVVFLGGEGRKAKLSSPPPGTDEQECVDGFGC